MRLTNDEAILAAFNGNDSTARDLAGRLEQANERVEQLEAALKLIANAVVKNDLDTISDVIENLDF
jgi:hypothetical protein